MTATAIDLFDEFNSKAWKVKDNQVKEFIKSIREKILCMSEPNRSLAVASYITAIKNKVRKNEC